MDSTNSQQVKCEQCGAMIPALFVQNVGFLPGTCACRVELVEDARLIIRQKREAQDRDPSNFRFVCELCGTVVEPVWYGHMTRYGLGVCPCRKPRYDADMAEQQQRERITRHDQWCQRIGLAGPLRTHRFEKFVIDKANAADRSIVDAVRAWARGFIAYAVDARQSVEDDWGINMILLSETFGNGKTMLAACVIQEALAEAHRLYDLNSRKIYDTTIARLTGWRWVQAVDLRTLAYNKEDKGAAFNRLKTCWGLVIDDVGKEYLKESGDENYNHDTHQLYYGIINARYLAGKPTIITSNVRVQDLEVYLGSSVRSRLSESGLIARMRGPDRRKGRMKSLGFAEGTAKAGS